MREYRSKPRDVAQEAIQSYMVRSSLRPHDKLPSERDMCEMWGLNRCTLRSAVAHMVREGDLYARRGAGTFVSPPKFSRNLQDLQSFTEAVAQRGMALETQLLSLETVECDKVFSQRFHLMLGEPLYKLVRLRRVDDAPLFIETSFLSAGRFPGLAEHDLEKDSLFALIEDDYGVSLSTGNEKISITYATPEEAALLQMDEGAPVFWIVSQTCNDQGELIEYCRTVARPDKIRLTSVLERRESR